MTAFADATVWLAYVAYPVTTAVYFERALKKVCRTVTLGPRLPEELIERWQLQNMKLPLCDQEIPTGFQPDMAELLARMPADRQPDLYLWVESVGGHCPRNLGALSCPKACYLIDSHLNLPAHLEWAANFDFALVAQREYLPAFREQGINAFWLPLGCDPEVHASQPVAKRHDVGFVGGVGRGSRREQLLARLNEQIPVQYERCFWDDMARLFSASRIVFNEAVRNDLNMRLFEVMSTGSLLLTDMARHSGQDILFRDGEDYAVYRDNDIVEVARFYLQNDLLREQVAARGQHLVHNAHTYGHRVDDLLAVTLGGKPGTFSAEELRERSLAGVPAVDAATRHTSCISEARRSFVIPVLDMSPASEYNIATLLRDLEEVEGDVIVIFNGAQVAEQLKGHPRITRYAIMKHNLGVSRAWNLGLEMAATPTVFILNADLHVAGAAIDALESALWELPAAACVGPQGSFVHFSLTRDYLHFDKGTFARTLEVDAVSGFFFAVKLEHFNARAIRFENALTPCYFEEWDLGLQIRLAGLKSYVVPTTAYDHHWSGSIRALREIRFYEKAETAGEILLRNRRFFLNKWRAIAAAAQAPELLNSRWPDYGKAEVPRLLGSGRFGEAQALLAALRSDFPGDQEIGKLERLVAMQRAKTGGVRQPA